ncbi:hypothetical protein SAV14893_011750 [Streptomyces avermitilis]|uniref:Uncharacterized protein n=1 Tax=Streptomyces avermitilis TaxID=33903 RepID=A0A4D4LKC4_STRAX|nr:hypothetical protein SAV14893_011750 [Streptomyces avermitilis]
MRLGRGLARGSADVVAVPYTFQSSGGSRFRLPFVRKTRWAVSTRLVSEWASSCRIAQTRASRKAFRYVTSLPPCAGGSALARARPRMLLKLVLSPPSPCMTMAS